MLALNFAVGLEFCRVLTKSFRERGLEANYRSNPILRESEVMTSPVCALHETPDVILGGAVTWRFYLRAT